tara:strand:- start:20 stop:517 length:498 start_codon:yes stop_codon:yes gene_type:complete
MEVSNDGKGAVMMFVMGCMQAYNSPSEFETFIENAKFPELPNNVANKLIREDGGKAYAVNFKGFKYILVAEQNNLCTIFSKNANPEHANQTLEVLLSGMRSKLEENVNRSEKEIEGGIMVTTGYEYSSPSGQNLIKIITTESTSESTNFKYAISITSAKRANNLL